MKLNTGMAVDTAELDFDRKLKDLGYFTLTKYTTSILGHSSSDLLEEIRIGSVILIHPGDGDTDAYYRYSGEGNELKILSPQLARNSGYKLHSEHTKSIKNKNTWDTHRFIEVNCNDEDIAEQVEAGEIAVHHKGEAIFINGEKYHFGDEYIKCLYAGDRGPMPYATPTYTPSHWYDNGVWVVAIWLGTPIVATVLILLSKLFN